jgi:hypothetical protein
MATSAPNVCPFVSVLVPGTVDEHVDLPCCIQMWSDDTGTTYERWANNIPKPYLEFQDEEDKAKHVLCVLDLFRSDLVQTAIGYRQTDETLNENVRCNVLRATLHAAFVYGVRFVYQRVMKHQPLRSMKHMSLVADDGTEVRTISPALSHAALLCVSKEAVERAFKEITDNRIVQADPHVVMPVVYWACRNGFVTKRPWIFESFGDYISTAINCDIRNCCTAKATNAHGKRQKVLTTPLIVRIMQRGNPQCINEFFSLLGVLRRSYINTCSDFECTGYVGHDDYGATLIARTFMRYTPPHLIGSPGWRRIDMCVTKDGLTPKVIRKICAQRVEAFGASEPSTTELHFLHRLYRFGVCYKAVLEVFVTEYANTLADSIARAPEDATGDTVLMCGRTWKQCVDILEWLLVKHKDAICRHVNDKLTAVLVRCPELDHAVEAYRATVPLCACTPRR